MGIKNQRLKTPRTILEIQQAIEEFVQKRDSASEYVSNHRGLDPYAAIHYVVRGLRHCRYSNPERLSTDDRDLVTCTHCLRSLE